MNFLNMVRTTREIVGMQGVGPTTTVGITGVDSVLATMVKDAYLDVQNLRDEFDFLNKKKSFSLEALKDEYTVSDIFLPDTSDINKYDLNSFKVTEDGKTYRLVYLERSQLEDRYINSDSTQRPNFFSIDYASNSVVLKPTPDKVYEVSFRYWREPEILSEDSQVPLLPVAFHMLIVYKAVEKMAIYLNVQGAYGEYNYEARVMANQLMRKSLRKKTLRTKALA